MKTRALLIASNQRARAAIASVRVLGRDPSTMAEVFDALWQRHRMRNAGLSTIEREHYRKEYLREHAPDLLRKI